MEITKDMLSEELIADFYKAQTLASEHLSVITRINKYFDALYGFCYNDTDNDQAIDSLDYGLSSISIEAFLTVMNEASKERKG